MLQLNPDYLVQPKSRWEVACDIQEVGTDDVVVPSDLKSYAFT